jgi:hypothetical protein
MSERLALVTAAVVGVLIACGSIVSAFIDRPTALGAQPPLVVTLDAAVPVNASQPLDPTGIVATLLIVSLVGIVVFFLGEITRPRMVRRVGGSTPRVSADDVA